MTYEYPKVHLLFKKMVGNVKDLYHIMTKVEELLHDPDFQVRLQTSSRDEVEVLARLLALYKKYASELNKMEL